MWSQTVVDCKPHQCIAYPKRPVTLQAASLGLMNDCLCCMVVVVVLKP